MNETAKAFFHEALGKVIPAYLSHDGCEAIITKIVDHLFAHPWVDEEVQRSMIGNIAADLQMEVPEEFRGEG